MIENERIITSIKNIAYEIFPYKRGQDTVSLGIYSSKDGVKVPFASIVDGWNDPNKFDSDIPGKEFANKVSERFPNLLLKSLESNSFNFEGVSKRAINIAKVVDNEVVSWYPSSVSCVGTFIIDLQKKNLITAVGPISTLLWDGKSWYKPEEFGDYVIDSNKYPSGAQRFFGRGELKNDPFYSVNPDTIVVDKGIPIFIATDGLMLENGIMTLDDLNKFSSSVNINNPKEFIQQLGNHIESIQDRQKDDISVFIKT
jgi:hypothetical protein